MSDKNMAKEKSFTEYIKLVAKSSRCTGNWIWMSNTLTHECRQVPAALENEYKKYGWVKGRSESSFKMSDRVWITKQGKCTRVQADKIEQFKQDGWVEGRTKSKVKGRVYVHNSTKRRMVKPDEAKRLVEDEGWSYGIGNRKT